MVCCVVPVRRHSCLSWHFAVSLTWRKACTELIPRTYLPLTFLGTFAYSAVCICMLFARVPAVTQNGASRSASAQSSGTNCALLLNCIGTVTLNALCE